MTEQDLSDRLEKAQVEAAAKIIRDFVGDYTDRKLHGLDRAVRQALIASLRRSAPEVSSVRVERVQMTRIVGGIDWAEREPADPTWRVIIGERCFDFETETEANNLKLAIDELAATRSAPASGEMREAVLAEREACAKDADERASCLLRGSDNGHGAELMKEAAAHLRLSADAIRARTPSGETREEAGS